MPSALPGCVALRRGVYCDVPGSTPTVQRRRTEPHPQSVLPLHPAVPPVRPPADANQTEQIELTLAHYCTRPRQSHSLFAAQKPPTPASPMLISKANAERLRDLIKTGLVDKAVGAAEELAASVAALVAAPSDAAMTGFYLQCIADAHCDDRSIDQRSNRKLAPFAKAFDDVVALLARHVNSPVVEEFGIYALGWIAKGPGRTSIECAGPISTAMAANLLCWDVQLAGCVSFTGQRGFLKDLGDAEPLVSDLLDIATAVTRAIMNHSCRLDLVGEGVDSLLVATKFRKSRSQVLRRIRELGGTDVIEAAADRGGDKACALRNRLNALPFGSESLGGGGGGGGGSSGGGGGGGGGGGRGSAVQTAAPAVAQAVAPVASPASGIKRKRSSPTAEAVESGPPAGQAAAAPAMASPVPADPAVGPAAAAAPPAPVSFIDLSGPAAASPEDYVPAAAKVPKARERLEKAEKTLEEVFGQNERGLAGLAVALGVNRQRRVHDMLDDIEAQLGIERWWAA